MKTLGNNLNRDFEIISHMALIKLINLKEFRIIIDTNIIVV